MWAEVMKCKYLKISALWLLIPGCAQQQGTSATLEAEANAGLAPAFEQIRLPVSVADRPAEPDLQRNPFATPEPPSAVKPGGSVRSAASAVPAPAAAPASDLVVGDVEAYRVSARHLGVPVTVVQRVVERTGSRLVVDETIDDGFVEPLKLRLRIEEGSDGSHRIVSVARLRDGVQVPYGSAAYADLMTLLRPPADEGAVAAADLGRNHFAWGGDSAKVRDDLGAVVFESEAVALGAAASDPLFRMAAVEASAADYAAWDAATAVEAPSPMLALGAQSDRDYGAWDLADAEQPAPVLAALGSEATYEAWDAASSAPVAADARLASADGDYERWDEQSGLFGIIALPDFAAKSFRPSAIATRDDSGDYLPDDE